MSKGRAADTYNTTTQSTHGHITERNCYCLTFSFTVMFIFSNLQCALLPKSGWEMMVAVVHSNSMFIQCYIWLVECHHWNLTFNNYFNSSFILEYLVKRCAAYVAREFVDHFFFFRMSILDRTIWEESWVKCVCLMCSRHSLCYFYVSFYSIYAHFALHEDVIHTIWLWNKMLLCAHTTTLELCRMLVTNISIFNIFLFVWAEFSRSVCKI